MRASRAASARLSRRRCGAALLAHQAQHLLGDGLHGGIDLEGFPVAAGGAAGHIDHRLDAPRAPGHHQHPIAEEHRLVDAVGDEEHGLSGGSAKSHQLFLQGQPRHGIDRGEGLVHQDHVGIGGPGARHGHALAHAARQLVRVALLEAGEPGQLDQAGDRALALDARHAGDLETVANVAAHRTPRQDRQLLEHHAALAARPAYRLAVAQDGAFGGPDEAGQRLEERGLAAAAGAYQRNELAGANGEVDMVGRLYGAVGGLEEMPEAGDDDLGFGGREVIRHGRVLPGRL